MKLSRSLV
jgi:hypothetical protein